MGVVEQKVSIKTVETKWLVCSRCGEKREITMNDKGKDWADDHEREHRDMDTIELGESKTARLSGGSGEQGYSYFLEGTVVKKDDKKRSVLLETENGSRKWVWVHALTMTPWAKADRYWETDKARNRYWI